VSHRAKIVALYVVSGLLLGAAAAFAAIVLLPWGLAIPVVLGLALGGRGFWLLRRSQNRPVNPSG
jgi:NhaP-type Na+/H+ or K+/H+ antiporter